MLKNCHLEIGVLIFQNLLLSRPILAWTVDDVAAFLATIGLSAREESFRCQRVDGEVLLDIDADMDLTDLGLLPADRDTLLREIALRR